MKRFLLLIFMLSLAILLKASPMAPQPELDVEGLIAVIEWVPERTEKGVWGMSGSLGGDRTFPAHYFVELVDCNVAVADGEIEPADGSMPWLKLGKQEKYSVSLNHPADDGFLKRGMRIKISGYHTSGDEGGIWTTFRAITREDAPTCPCENTEEPNSALDDDVLAVPDTPGPEPLEGSSSLDLQP
ncbi:MAG: hypothetical protein CVV42_16205 [Candidatus Riflebacteria bacterium HGW-Riflebacteria-2]|nr:MAG: hypothetical protein CVV42_16205 [Candidatus Riflebacteria bacterium HGW-Riflebacteria-2]